MGNDVTLIGNLLPAFWNISLPPQQIAEQHGIVTLQAINVNIGAVNKVRYKDSTG
jgi:hypothetical protein